MTLHQSTVIALEPPLPADTAGLNWETALVLDCGHRRILFVQDSALLGVTIPCPFCR